MQAFRFSLEKVLTWRGKLLDREEARLETLKAERRRIELHLDQLRATRIAERNRVRRSGEVLGGELAALDAFGRHLDDAERRGLDALRSAEEAVARQEKVLVEARRSVRLLERLKQRRLEEWKEEEAREYDTQAGEAALVQWRRRN
jgi:flagellar export protein FliJ